MSTVLADSIVVIAIVVSAGYAVWRLGPRKLRDALRMRLRTSLPSVFGNLTDSSGSGCDTCGGCATTTNNVPATRKEHGVFWRKKAAR